MFAFGAVHNFAARCPRGHRPAQSRTLADLRSPNVRFYCRLCEKAWAPKQEEIARALEFAQAAEQDWVSTPPTAA